MIQGSDEYAEFKRLRHDNTLYPNTRVSIMMDSMIAAVDDGFSYDGIVSIPETGLEDWHRHDLVGWLNAGVVRPLFLLAIAITKEGSYNSGAILDNKRSHFAGGI